MLEQQLINAFMKLAAKAGAGEIIREMIQQVEQNGNPKVWTALEMERALKFINQQVENFGKAEALVVVETLIRKFEITDADLHHHNSLSSASSGIQGLQ